MTATLTRVDGLHRIGVETSGEDGAGPGFMGMVMKAAANDDIRALAGKAARVVLAAAFAILALVQLGAYAVGHSRVADFDAAFAEATVVARAAG